MRDLESLESHPVIGPPIIDIVASAMNLAANLRGKGIFYGSQAVMQEVSSGSIHHALGKINLLIGKVNSSLPEGRKIRKFTPMEFFSLIMNRAR